MRRHAEDEQELLHAALLLGAQARRDGAGHRHEREHNDAHDRLHEQHHEEDLVRLAQTARAAQHRVLEAAVVRQQLRTARASVAFTVSRTIERILVFRVCARRRLRKQQVFSLV